MPKKKSPMENLRKNPKNGRPRSRKTTAAWDQQKVLKELSKLLKLGYTLNRACELSGLNHSTVQTWMRKDPTIRLQITQWQNELSLAARKVWSKSIKKGRPTKFGMDKYTPAKEWLERREKDEFSTRQEQTGKDGESLTSSFTDQQADRIAMRMVKKLKSQQ